MLTDARREKKPIPHVTSLSGVKRAKSSADVKFALIWKMENFFVPDG